MGFTDVDVEFEPASCEASAHAGMRPRLEPLTVELEH
jgi:hypothetical protein